MSDSFTHNENTPFIELGGGTRRKILSHSDNLMAVEVYFEEGAVGAPHTHPHEQIAYIIEGEFEFTNDGEMQVVKAGDSVKFAPNVLHGAVCRKAGKVLDIFTPCRLDFLK